MALQCSKCGKEKGLMAARWYQCTAAPCNKPLCPKCAGVTSIKAILAYLLNGGLKVGATHPAGSCPHCHSNVKMV
jgi:ssDNA-binding Zn-finger/Zn-ribbon topoisomerase 1